MNVNKIKIIINQLCYGYRFKLVQINGEAVKGCNEMPCLEFLVIKKTYLDKLKRIINTALLRKG